MKIFIYSLVLAMTSSCFTTGKKDDDHAKGEDGKDKDGQSKIEEDDFYSVSGNLDTFTVSLSNSSLTSKHIDRGQASSVAAKLEAAIHASKGDDRKALISLMSLKRIAGEGLGSVLDIAKKLVALEMKKNIEHGLPEFGKIEIVLAAIQSKKNSLAEYYIGDLVNSKNKKVRAAAFTAEGIIAAQDDRLPEAVESWNKALGVIPDFEPALLNIGFVALKYGDFARAKKMLSGMQGDWFASYGLVSAERMTKDSAKASELCKKVLAAQPRHKPALFNCALNAFEGEKKYDEALGMLDKMSKVSGNSNWDDKIYKLKQEIEREASSKRRASSDGAAKVKK